MVAGGSAVDDIRSERILKVFFVHMVWAVFVQVSSPRDREEVFLHRLVHTFCRRYVDGAPGYPQSRPQGLLSPVATRS